MISMIMVNNRILVNKIKLLSSQLEIEYRRGKMLHVRVEEVQERARVNFMRI
jgi:hypothetical protein